MFLGKNSALRGAKAYTQFAANGTRQALARTIEEVIEAGEAQIRRDGNEEESERCRVKHGDVGGPWVSVKTLGVSGFLLPTFLCRCKEK